MWLRLHVLTRLEAHDLRLRLIQNPMKICDTVRPACYQSRVPCLICTRMDLSRINIHGKASSALAVEMTVCVTGQTLAACVWEKDVTSCPQSRGLPVGIDNFRHVTLCRNRLFDGPTALDWGSRLHEPLAALTSSNPMGCPSDLAAIAR